MAVMQLSWTELLPTSNGCHAVILDCVVAYIEWLSCSYLGLSCCLHRMAVMQLSWTELLPTSNGCHAVILDCVVAYIEWL